MRKILPAVLWLIFIYILTALAEDLPPPPDGFWAFVLKESRHVAAHSIAYAVLTMLIVTAVGHPGADWRSWRPLVALIVVLGVGQEIQQVLMRHKIQYIGSPIDLLVDASGATFALWLYPKLTRWRAVRLRRDAASRPNPLPNQ